MSEEFIIKHRFLGPNIDKWAAFPGVGVGVGVEEAPLAALMMVQA